MKTTQRPLRPGLIYFYDGQGQRMCSGAQMGRRNNLPADCRSVTLLHLVRLRLSGCGCYDQGGAYWGIGNPVYWAYDPDSVTEVFFRATGRVDAKRQARTIFPNARFYN